MKRASWIETLLGGRYAFLVLVALVSYFWLPALLHGKLLVHGDSAHHGLSLLILHAKSLAGHESLLWSNRIYGGHPLFAESQGAFANPLNIISAWLFTPSYALGFLHWITSIVGMAGIFCLCRLLGISRWSATFASIAAVFSGYLIVSQYSMAITTLAWCPWLMAAAEYWLKQPSLRRAALLAIFAALLVFCGYPQIPQGVVLYLLASFLAQPLQRESRKWLVEHWRAFLLTGLGAVVLAIGLSAIQFFPLMELVGQSYRSEGVAVLFNEVVSPIYALRGLLYFYLGTADQGSNLTSLGSIPVFLLFCLILFFRLPPRILGHVLGVFLLFNLGMGSSSPLFRLVYDYHLIPGMHYHRIMQPYFGIMVLGFAVVAAHVLDALSEPQLPALWGVLRKRKVVLGSAAAIFAAGFLYLCYRCYAPVYSALNFFAAAAMVAGFAVLCLLGKRRWFPLLAVLLLSIDVLALRVHVFGFYSPQILEQPEVIRSIAADADMPDYRVMDASLSTLMTFLEPNDPQVGIAYRQALQALTPFPLALQWNIPSINGVTGLPLSRRALLDSAFSAELWGSVPEQPGLRLMDIWGIRYASLNGQISTPGFALYWADQKERIFIYRNQMAKPRFQVYSNVVAVDTPEQALAGLQAAQTATLFIERRAGERLELPGACTACVEQKPTIEVVEARAMRYRVNVDMPREGWLFLADANYPGWEATVNGLKQPVYGAQVLGKAVRLAAGRNAVTIRYVPRTFYWGAALSATTLLLVIFILVRRRRAAVAA